MGSQKVQKAFFPSFRRKSLDVLGTLSSPKGPESSVFKSSQILWTPVFTGVTTFCKRINVVAQLFGAKESTPLRTLYAVYLKNRVINPR
jgi:hypothetical protein